MNETPLFEVDETLTVGQITRRLSEIVRRTFSNEIWVQGQIRNLSRSGRGHVYFDLVDPVAAGAQPKASIAVTLFDSTRQVVNRILTRTGNNVRIDDGVEVRIKANVEMYVPRGQVQLNMTSIDPEFTLGRLGADRDQLLHELKAEGLIDANAQAAMPLVPLRIALITSGGSAAHADFSQQLAASGYTFEITTLSTRVQGQFAPEEIADMIRLGDTDDIDVLAVVRGGGARTDLAAFDSAPVARAIAACSKPVLCGIGHEIDNSVADLVAHVSLKTPTACAQFLIERVIEFDSMLFERAQLVDQYATAIPVRRLSEIDARARSVGERVAATLHAATARNVASTAGLERRVERAITRSEHRLAATQTRLTACSVAALASGLHRCARQEERLADRPHRLLRQEQQRLDLLAAKLSAVDPVQALRRGYSITTTTSGRLVRDPDDVAVGTELHTRFAEGTVTSTVTATATNTDRPRASAPPTSHKDSADK